MGYVQPAAMRATVRPTATGLELSIPAKRNWFLLLFLSCWLCGWLVGEIMVPLAFFRSATPLSAQLFTGAWLGLWTLGGLAALYAWLWQLGGKEVVILTPTALIRRRELCGLSTSKEFGMAHLRHLRVSPLGWTPFDLAAAAHVWGLSGGPIAFDYGAKRYRFGAGLDEAEAAHLVRLAKARVQIPEESQLT